MNTKKLNIRIEKRQENRYHTYFCLSGHPLREVTLCGKIYLHHTVLCYHFVLRDFSKYKKIIMQIADKLLKKAEGKPSTLCHL